MLASLAGTRLSGGRSQPPNGTGKAGGKQSVYTNKGCCKLKVGTISSLTENEKGEDAGERGTRWVRKKARCEAGQSK